MTKQHILQLLRDLVEVHGEQVTLPMFLNMTGVSEEEVISQFGSWHRFRVSAGLGPERRGGCSPVTADQILETLRRFVELRGERISLRVFAREIGISERVIFDRCGSWSKLRKVAGLPPRANSRLRITPTGEVAAAGEGSKLEREESKPRITAEEILERLRQELQKHGENITFAVFKIETGFSERMIVSLFGRWSKLRMAAGLAPHAKAPARFTREDLLADMYQVYQRTGKEPRPYSHRHDGGRICLATFRDHFGSWENAKRAFEEYRRQKSR